MGAETAALISAVASVISAAGSAGTLWLLGRQLQDARRFGAAPAVYALLKEFEELMSSVRLVEGHDATDSEWKRTLTDLMEFFERVEHLRLAGLLPISVLKRAFGPALAMQLADSRVIELMREEGDPLYAEVFSLAKVIAPLAERAKRKTSPAWS